LYFNRPSTRTRTSFFWAINKLGGNCILYNAADLQLGNGESAEDTAMALGLFLDVLVVRTDAPSDELYDLVRGSDRLRVINGLSADEHPTQVIADLITMKQEFSSLEDRHVLYIGASNNTSNSLILGASMVPKLRVSVVSPSALSTPSNVRDLAKKQAIGHGSSVSFLENIEELSQKVDVIYTTRWESMGSEPKLDGWRDILPRYRVSEDLMEKVGTNDCIFMHDMPATRGLEITDGALDGDRSRVRRQAFNKGVSAAICLEHVLS
jgi:ornithine carbamoyltransferase